MVRTYAADGMLSAHTRVTPLTNVQAHAPQRQFHYTPAAHARKEKKLPVLSKKQLAAKERKRAKKAPKNIYDSEKMSLGDAIDVLRVRHSFMHSYLPF